MLWISNNLLHTLCLKDDTHIANTTQCVSTSEKDPVQLNLNNMLIEAPFMWRIEAVIKEQISQNIF